MHSLWKFEPTARWLHGLVEKYLHLDKTSRPRTVAGLYERVLDSAQGANMGARQHYISEIRNDKRKPAVVAKATHGPPSL